MWRNKRVPTFLLGMILLTACGDGSPAGPDPNEVASLQIASIDPAGGTLIPGEQLQLEATALSRDGTVVEAEIDWESRAPAVASVSGSGLVRGIASGEAWIVASTSSGIRDSVLIRVVPPPAAACEPSAATTFAVGEVMQFAGVAAGSLCLGPGEYVAIPFYSTQASSARLALAVGASGITDIAGPPSPARVPSVAADVPIRLPDSEWERRLREREILELSGLIQELHGARPQRVAFSPVLDVPQLGELLTFNTSADCTDTSNRTARVMAISDRAIIAADTLNPAGGLSMAEYASVAETVDTLIYPVDVANFGEPADIDANSRMIILYTGAVNERTEADSKSFVGGFFWSGDLFPKVQCAGSNFAEMFYMLAADPNGSLGNKFSREFVVRTTLNTVGHELQHLINASRRLHVNNASSFETVWLGEALSHIAEELLFYRLSGYEPRKNLGGAEVGASQRTRDAANTFLVSNLSRYRSYLENPDTVSLIGADALPTRGAGWAFLRYAADRQGGSDQQFFHSLANSTEIGLANLQQVIGEPALEWMQDWTVSVYADDAVPGAPSTYQQPSWDFRALLPLIGQGFPLRVTPLRNGTHTFSIRAGGSVFVRFAVPSGGAGELVWTSADAVPPPELRLSMQRTK